MTQIQDEYERMRRRARELAKKGLTSRQIAERLAGMCVVCPPPHRTTVGKWIHAEEYR